MCDLDKEIRRKRYKKLRKVGHTSGFAHRARDFSNPHYLWHTIHKPNMLNPNDFDLVVLLN